MKNIYALNYARVILINRFIFDLESLLKLTPQPFEVGITTYEEIKNERDFMNHQSQN